MPFDFGSAIGGAADAGSADIVQRRTHALEYKMKSKLIQDELDAKERLYDYQKLSPDTTKFLGTQAGGDLGSIFQNQPEGYRISNEDGSLLSSQEKARLAASRPRAGANQGLSLTAAKLLSEKYGIPVDKIMGMKSSEAYTVFKQGSDAAIKDVEAAVQSLNSVPEFYNQLKALKNNPAAMTLAQTKGAAGMAAYPDVQNARNHMITLMAFSNGGKNLTAIEKSAIDDLATGWAYGPETSLNAERRFREMLINNIKPRLNSGALGMARKELLGQFNDALIKNGLEPIPMNMGDTAPKAASKTTGTHTVQGIDAEMTRRGLDLSTGKPVKPTK